jgi:hypothetical protein
MATFVQIFKTLKQFCGSLYVICVIDCTVIKGGAIVHTTHVLVQKYFVFSHAFVIVFTLSTSLLLLHFNISSGMNSVSDTCKLSYL